MRIHRAFAGAVAAAVLLAACGPEPTSSHAGLESVVEEKVGTNGCPIPFYGPTVVKYGTEASEADRNADGYICYLEVVAPDDKSLIHTTYVDNVIPPNEIAGCPKDFTLQFYKVPIGGEYYEWDRNRDGYFCVGYRPNGEKALVDNHFR
jgi:hypothetical protein